MKLSEAIRLGAMLKPQHFGHFTDGHATCAMGAAADAVGGWPRVYALKPKWDAVICMPSVRCPACGDEWRAAVGVNPGGAAIVHLNDQHRWTRERIADWVAIVEAQHEAPAVEPQPVSVEG